MRRMPNRNFSYMTLGSVELSETRRCINGRINLFVATHAERGRLVTKIFDASTKDDTRLGIIRIGFRHRKLNIAMEPKLKKRLNACLR